jgi:hypothetical protein
MDLFYFHSFFKKTFQFYQDYKGKGTNLGFGWQNITTVAWNINYKHQSLVDKNKKCAFYKELFISIDDYFSFPSFFKKLCHSPTALKCISDQIK